MLKVSLPLCGDFSSPLSAGRVSAQDAEMPDLDDIKAPASPAFVILEVAPSKWKDRRL